ncbi:hypothetical protein [Actinoplanes sp. HUAS TT8]|uniref:hypothetical protein n=1 Tax=Actinoplanes sp. HUAS TT8 TaxID=3447453 RepID=UPI003F5258B9
MHDQVLGLLDDCLSKLMTLRADLAAARCVRLGERRGLVLEAIDIADEFATSAGVAIGERTARELEFVAPARDGFATPTGPVPGEPGRGIGPALLSEAAC